MRPGLRDSPLWYWAVIVVVLAIYAVLLWWLLAERHIRATAFILGTNTAFLVALIAHVRRPPLVVADARGIELAGARFARAELRGVRLVVERVPLLGRRVVALLADLHDGRTRELPIEARSLRAREARRTIERGGRSAGPPPPVVETPVGAVRAGAPLPGLPPLVLLAVPPLVVAAILLARLGVEADSFGIGILGGGLGPAAAMAAAALLGAALERILVRRARATG